ncbi:hypothetical protein GCM10010387_37220 [Streptomyces inusitatus]|uniref:Uncharacterized protein n=1 Tax=Streptomyces inusitatus TaxID=68221 RepID=A0A918QC96_9ACTN|nr:hypothetical protein [Streptomyces inusitatus]GGZ39522.1 hypothetical protein GCM10010387_37220 [Streptomyces inusitatus]
MPSEAPDTGASEAPDTGTGAGAGRHERILRVLDRLLYDAPFRAAFISGGPRNPEFPVDGDLIDAFGRVDPHELTLVGRRIRSKVVGGTETGTGAGAGAGTRTGPGLKDAFPRTLEAVRELHGVTANELAEAFIASPSFQDFRDVPFSPRGRGTTLPECFHHFMAAPPPFDPGGALEPLVHFEAATAVARAVAAGAGATFAVTLPESAFHGSVFCAFREYDEAPAAWALRPTMYLADAGRCVVGPARRPVFEALRTILAGRGELIAAEVREPLEQRLRAWGFRRQVGDRPPP